MSEPGPRVLLVDDSAELRDVVRSSLEAHGISVVAQAADGDSAIAAARRSSPQVVVLDVGIPGASAADVIEQLRSLQPAPRVVVYSGWPAAQLAGLGVTVVAKSAQPMELVQAIRLAALEPGR